MRGISWGTPKQQCSLWGLLGGTTKMPEKKRVILLLCSMFACVLCGLSPHIFLRGLSPHIFHPEHDWLRQGGMH